MELTNQNWTPPVENRLTFKGNGGSLFEIFLVNYLLGIVTFGMYYPWGRARKLKYIYGETSFYGSRLAFHGTGKEMFVGFIKAVLIIAAFFGFMAYTIFVFVQQIEDAGGIEYTPATPLLIMMSVYGILFLFIILVMPLAIHGAFKYRLAKTSWRGIRLGYRGKRGQLYGIFVRDFFITIFTGGIYRSWFDVNLRKYIIGHIRFGDVSFSFKGDGADLFLINLKGIALSILTLGIYSFWYMRELYEFRINNVRVHQNGNEYRLKSTASVAGMVELILVNWLMVTFTFGIATPWAIARQLRFYLANAVFDENFDPNLITQTEQEYNNALAEDLSDMFDLGFI